MGRSHKIWVIEDDELFRSSLEELIGSSDQMRLALSVDSVEKAMAHLGEPAPDVILSDIGLPGISGIEGIPKFKEQWPDIEIIMLTIYEDDERIFNAIKSGASGYLLKRTPAPKILDAIQQVIHDGSPITPSIARKVLGILSGSQSKAKENPLTNREQEILGLLVDGNTQDMISAELHISHHTVGTHVKNIYKKLQVHNRAEAVSKAIRKRLIE